MPLRPLRLPQDFSLFTSLLPATFVYPENESWNVQADEEQSLADAAKSLRRFWPVIRLMQKLTGGLEDLMSGFVWEENQQPVGMINYQRMGITNKWYIANVSVLPEFRRRGIARQMVEAGIEAIKGKHGERIVLDVISDNVPAYHLYESLGFDHYTGSVQMNLMPSSSDNFTKLPDRITVEALSLSDTQLKYELAKRITPANIQAYDPVNESRFRQPAAMNMLLPFIWRASGLISKEFAFRSQDGLVVGRARYQIRKRSGGQNVLSAFLEPADAELAAGVTGFLMEEINRQSPGRRIVFEIPEWQPHLIEAAQSVGFNPRWVFHKMALNLQLAND